MVQCDLYYCAHRKNILDASLFEFIWENYNLLGLCATQVIW